MEHNVNTQNDVSIDSSLNTNLDPENNDEIESQDVLIQDMDSDFDDFYFFWDENESIENE
jgi:hypothetical protein